MTDFNEKGAEAAGGPQGKADANAKAQQKEGGNDKGKAAEKPKAPAGPSKEKKSGGGDGDKGDDASPPASRHFEDFEEVLLLDYNSKRKRMTIIVRPFDTNGQPRDKVYIYSKGADTSIATYLADDDPYWDSSVQPALGDFGGESLRTLVCAYGEKEADFFSKFQSKMDDAMRSQGKEEEKGHVDGECGEKCKICAVENEVEEAADLVSLGCTAIEDKLQEGVPLSAAESAGRGHEGVDVDGRHRVHCHQHRYGV